MDAIECIKTRRSVRQYTEQSINQHIIRQILEAGISAPSGKNGQPWKFKIITDKDLICSVSKLSIYGSWMKTSPLFITVFLDNTCSYDRVKDNTIVRSGYAKYDVSNPCTRYWKLLDWRDTCYL